MIDKLDLYVYFENNTGLVLSKNTPCRIFKATPHSRLTKYQHV